MHSRKGRAGVLKRAVVAGALIGALAGLLEAAAVARFSGLYFTASGRAALMLAAAAMYAVYGAAAASLLFPVRSLFRRPGEERAAVTAAAFSLALLYSLAFFLSHVVLSRKGLFSVRSFLWAAGLLLASFAAAYMAGRAVPPLLRSRKSRLIVAAAVLALVIRSFIPPGKGAAPGKDTPDVVLVTIDTIRADRLNCYGGGARTPAMDRLAAEGVLFDNAISQVPITNPSHLSLLSSRYPHKTGVLDNVHVRPAGLSTIVDEFKGRGYETTAFVSSFTLDSRFGFGKGFDIYDDDSSAIKGFQGLALVRAAEGLLRGIKCPVFRRLALERNAARTNREVFSWLGERAESPLFLWVHYFDPHGPYTPPSPYSGMYYAGTRNDPENRSMDGIELPGWAADMGEFTDIEYPIAQYDAEITYTDAELGRLVRELDGMLGDYILVVAGDHGENLTEHGDYFTHGDRLYDEQVRVPLIIRRRGQVRPAVVDSVVENIDIAPTVMEMAGFDIPETFEGESLVPLMRGEGGRAREGALSATALRREDGSLDIAYRTGRYKLIMKAGEESELYDLESDPGERRDIAGERGDLVKVYEEKVRSALSASAAEAGVLDDAGTREKLKSLGYIR